MIKVIFVLHGIFEKHWRVGRRKKLIAQQQLTFFMLLCIFFWSCSCSYFYMVQMALHQPLFSFMIIFYLRWFQKHLCYGCCYLTMVVIIITLSFAIINNLIHKAFPNLGFFSSLSSRIIGAKHPGILTFFWSITQNCFVKGSNWLIYPQPLWNCSGHIYF